MTLRGDSSGNNHFGLFMIEEPEGVTYEHFNEMAKIYTTKKTKLLVSVR